MGHELYTFEMIPMKRQQKKQSASEYKMLLVPGLKNLRNTCYLNVVIQVSKDMLGSSQRSKKSVNVVRLWMQVLAGSSRFIESLQQSIDLLEAFKYTPELTTQLLLLLKRLAPNTKGSTSSLSTGPFVFTLRQYLPEGVLTCDKEHDAVEALEAIALLVNEELVAAFERCCAVQLAACDAVHSVLHGLDKLVANSSYMRMWQAHRLPLQVRVVLRWGQTKHGCHGLLIAIVPPMVPPVELLGSPLITDKPAGQPVCGAAVHRMQPHIHVAMHGLFSALHQHPARSI
jgi:hypothetical protein